jgi:hypothetical protein
LPAKDEGDVQQVIGREAHKLPFYQTCVFSRPRQRRRYALRGFIFGLNVWV